MFRELSWPADECDGTPRELQKRLKIWIVSPDTSPWFRFYQFVELLPQLAAISRSGSELSKLITMALNRTLEQHGSTYRLISEKLAPITNEQEAAEVQAATSAPERFAPAREHIN
jgi:hypothetical protein